LERELSPKYGRVGTHRQACGGLWEQAYHQGYDSESIIAKVREMVGATWCKGFEDFDKLLGA